MIEQVEMTDGYQIQVVNIKYGRELNTSKKIKEKPEMVVLDVPEEILKNKNKGQKFLDMIESFAYNTVTRKYGAEVHICQVYLPLDD